jgi:phospholipid/cholesterol/gamma-HCH transport system substrate-binding protein
MPEYTRTEIIAGGFLLAGLASLVYLSISLGGMHLMPASTRRFTARFSNVGDLKVRAPVKIAGVTIGQVRSIRLADYYGEIELTVDRKVAMPTDTIASIATSGLLGESFLSLSPGADERNLPDGGQITHTEPALNVADLLARYAFGGAGTGAAGASGAKDGKDAKGAATDDKTGAPRTPSRPTHAPPSPTTPPPKDELR